MYYKYDEDIFGGLKGIDKAIKTILKQINLIVEDEDLLFDLRLILNELLINAFTHGNKKDLGKAMHLSLILDDIELKIKVMDEGRGVNSADYCYNCADLKNHGRGLVIVEKLADSVFVEGNIVRCILSRDDNSYSH